MGLCWLLSAAVQAQGVLDPSFGTGGRVYTSFTPAPPQDIASAMAVQADGKIVVVGGSPIKNVGFELARYLPNGTLDPTFGTGGKVITTFPNATNPPSGFTDNGVVQAWTITIQADGKLVVGGIRVYEWGLARYNTDGSLDTSFGTGGFATLLTGTYGGGVVKINQLSSGKLMVTGGASTASRNFIYLYFANMRRYNTNGTLDNSFTPVDKIFPGNQPIVDGERVADVVVDATDRLLVAGYSYQGSSVSQTESPVARLMRLLPDGTPDASFGTNGLGAAIPTTISKESFITDIELLPTGQILAVGQVGTFNFLARYTPDGALDPSFGTNGLQLFTDFGVEAFFFKAALTLGLAVQTDGKIVVHGRKGVDFALARFAADGPADLSFGVEGQMRINGGAYGALTDMVIQPDGNYLGAGIISSERNPYVFDPPTSQFALLRVLSRANCTEVNAGNDRTLCGNTPTTLGTLVHAGLNYNWAVSPAISGFSSTSAQPTLTLPNVTKPTVYTFTVTATANTQCVATDEVQVTVLPGINANFGAQASPAVTTPGQSVVLSVTNPQLGATYSWSGPGISEAKGTTTTLLPPGSGTYTVTATLGTCSAQAQVRVTVSGSGQNVPGWVWASNAGGPGQERPSAIVSDAAGNSYVAGTFEGTATFGSTQLVSQGGSDIFVAKYDAAGNPLWARRYGGTGPDAAYGLARDKQGNLVLTGSYAGSIAFGPTTLTSPATAELYVAKLDADGGVLWARGNEAARAGSTNVGRALVVDPAGNIYLTGHADNALTWSGTTKAARGTNAEAIILKLTAQGALVWAQRFGGGNPDYGLKLTLSNNASDLYVTGTFTDDTDVSGNSVMLYASRGCVFVLECLALNGDCRWALASGGAGPAVPEEIIIDNVGDLHLLVQGYSPQIVYYTSVGATVTPRTLTKSSAAGTPDSYVFNIHNGSISWGFRLGTCAANSSIRASSMTIRDGLLHIAGWYNGTVDFGTTSLTTPAGSGNLGFLLKTDTWGVTQWTQQTSSGDALITGLSQDGVGNYHVAGYFGAYTTSGFGASTVTTRGGNDAFVARLGIATPRTARWTGAASTAWTDAGNWGSYEVPGSADYAVVPGGLTRYPATSGDLLIGSLDLQTGATLTQTGGQLSVMGSFANAGTFTQSGGTLALTGGAAQTLGTASAPTSLLNLTVGSAGARLAGPVQVQGLLTLTGNLNTTAQEPLTLLSNATGTATVYNSGGVVNGNVTVQRWIDPAVNAGLGYRHLSSPVTGSTVADLAAPNFTPVVNPAFNGAANPALVTPYPTVFGYNDARLTGPAADFDMGWESPASLSEPLAVGRGYTVSLSPQTVDFVGSLTNGTVDVPLTRGTGGSGWNLVGNPYPSPLDWDQVVLPAAIDAAAYVYRSTGPYAGGFQAYVNGVGAPGGQLLAMGQAFFVRANSNSPTLRLTNAARPNELTNPALLRGTETRPLLALALRGTVAAHEDLLYVYQQSGATAGFDARFDALKPLLNGGQQPSIYQLAGTQALSIQGLPMGPQPVDLPLAVHAPTAGSFTLAAAQLLNFPADATLYLEDRQTNTWHNLLQGSLAVALPQGLTAARFVLHLYAPRALATQAAQLPTALAVYPNPASGGQVMVEAAGLATGGAELQLHNTLGQLVRRQAAQPTGGTLRQELSLHGLPLGVYTLRLVTAGGTATQRLVVR